MVIVSDIQVRYHLISAHFNERTRRLWAASEAQALGYGGVSQVAKATGISRRAITKGLKELNEEAPLSLKRVRKPGGGPKRLRDKHPGIKEKLESLVEPLTRGDPDSPLRWTCKSTRLLAEEMRNAGWPISDRSVSKLLHELDYSLQGNHKTLEGNQHPDREAQLEYINASVAAAMAEKQPVISVDTKKKELIGNDANNGRQRREKGRPPKVGGPAFPYPPAPRAFPYGRYDLTRNQGFVNVGLHHDTAAFAVQSIREWWQSEGRGQYPGARRLLITADGGGSNGSRLPLWKWELQELARDLRIPVIVSHFPPATSKWNKVGHRLFSFISSNWRGEPLSDYETVVKLIGNATTRNGLTVKCQLDLRQYPAGRQTTNAEMKEINLLRNEFHGDWNYTILP
ncbi:MAG: ISAzo13 family transposase [Candidatus Adiutrix sp.]|jgi:transposase|nr:ISAzo13 family transposase [Candidatus Adiutrix sp.]